MKLKMYKFINWVTGACALLLITTVFSACQKNGTTEDSIPVVPILAAQSTNDVAYGTDPLQKFNLYLPAGRSNATTKVLIVIHPGAWASLDKNDADWLSVIDSLKKRLPAYAIFNVNHRLASFTGNVFPTQENDIKAAVDFIYSKRNEYGVSDKFVLLGASSGAHLALLQAYKNPVPKIKAVVDLFGPADMTKMFTEPASSSPQVTTALAFLMSGTPASNAALYQSSSSINFVENNSAPTIIFHGGVADTLVRTAQSLALRDKLVQKGVVNQYVNYPTEGHGWIGVNLTDTFNKLVAFLNANVL